MVLKLHLCRIITLSPFESDVISDGTQTQNATDLHECQFESDVISDGTQTCDITTCLVSMFESDVISDGTQTF